MSKPRVGCQPIIFGGYGDRKYTLEERLAAMAAAGYDGVEAGPPGSREAEEKLQALLDRHGLAVLGSHTGFDGLVRPDALDAQIAFLRDFDAKFLMVSGTGDRSTGAASYLAAAEKFNECGRRAREEGVTLCYHNHSWEFHDVFDEGTGMRIILENTDPEIVRLCIDTYWVHDGGLDPAGHIAKHVDRLAVLHLKDRKDNTFCEVGEGVLDFDGILEAAEPAEIEWVVTEQDTTRREPAESIRMSRERLRALGV